MAIGQHTVWEVRTTGSTTNGGGFRHDSSWDAPLAPTFSSNQTSGGRIPAGTSIYAQVVYLDANDALTLGGPTAFEVMGSSTDANRVTVNLPVTGRPATGKWNVYIGNSSTGPFWYYTGGMNISSPTTVISNSPPPPPSSLTAVTPYSLTCAGSSTGGAIAAGTYYFAAVLVDGDGLFTTLSTPSSPVTTTGSTSSIAITPPDKTGWASWILYGSTNINGPYWSLMKSSNFLLDHSLTTSPITSQQQQARGTDYSIQDAAQLSLSDIVCSASSNRITSATGGFTRAMVGNIIQLQGTNAGFYEVIAYVDSNTVFLDRATTNAASGVSGKLGGAIDLYASSQAAVAIQGNKVFVKSGTYTLPDTGNGSGGLTYNNVTTTPSNTNQPLRIIGYYSSRNDGGFSDGTDYRPNVVLQTSAVATPIVFKFNNNGAYIYNMKIDCASVTSSTGIKVASNSQVYNCKISNFTVYGVDVTGATGTLTYGCEITGGTAAATGGVFTNSQVAFVVGCNIHDNACTGINCSSGVHAVYNLIYNNSGATSDGIRSTSNAQTFIINNTIHNNGQHGINMTASSNNTGFIIKNNLITNNVGRGLALGSATPGIPIAFFCDLNTYFSNNSSTTYSSQILYDNAQGTSNVGKWVNQDKNCVASPYIDAANSNFKLNNTPNAGLLCIGTGAPILPGTTYTSDFNIGVFPSGVAPGGGGAGVSIARLIGGV